MLKQKLTYKLTLMVIVPVILSLMVFGSLSYFIFKEQLMKDRIQDAVFIINLSAEELKNPLYFLDIEQLNNIIKNIKQNQKVISVYIIDPGGKVITDGTSENRFYDQKLNDEFGNKSIISDVLISETNNDVLQISAPIVITRKIGTVWIVFSLRELEQVSRKMNFLTILIGATIFLVIATINMFTTRSISGPIIKFRDAADEIGRGNLGVTLEIRSKDEIGELATAFNKMIYDLKRSKEEIISAKEFTDNIVSSMTETLMVVSKEGTIQTLNPAACNLLGYEEKDLIGQPIDKVLIDYGDLLFDEKDVQLFKKGITRNMEKTYLSKDSKRIPVIFSASIMYDDKNKVLGIVCIALDIRERKKNEEALKASEEKYRDLFENANDAICILDSDLNYKDVNKKVSDLLGYSREELLNMNVYDIIPHEQIPRSAIEFEKLRKNGSYKEFVGKIRTKNGELKDFEVSSSAIIDGGKIVGSRDILRDITERKRMEENIMKSLQEKEVLLREIHHRVKNNMQIISSLLMLQSQYSRNKKDDDIFLDSQNRILSMSLVHEKLYQSNRLAEIDFKEYIEDLVSGLFHSHGIETGNIVLNINVKNISLPIDSAIPCGLIINELVTNSLKYAFPKGMKGEINISLRSINDTMIDLVVADNGIGIPKNIDFKKTESFGLHLVTILVENQLHGEIDLNRSNGTEFLIKFKG